MNELIELFTQWKEHSPQDVERLPGQGSNRVYYRLWDADGHHVIGVEGTSCEENQAFIYLSRHFSHRQLPVPKILAVSCDGKYYLQTDLGCRSLFDALKGGREAGGRYNEEERRLLIRTIRELPNIQIRGARGLDWNKCYPQPEFDADSILFDLNYFKYCFLKATELEFNELKLQADFRLFAKELLAEKMESFLYRDFQARNVMLDAQGNPFFIDFQGGRKGPFYYDVASFLWQASARYSFKLRRELVKEYYEALSQYTEVPSKRHFVHRLSLFVLFRTLQVLGAYGFRGYFEHKQHFLESIPPAIQNLRDLLKSKDAFPYPYLLKTLKSLTELPQFSEETKVSKEESNEGSNDSSKSLSLVNSNDGPATVSKYEGKGKLVVRVYSFSYKKGIPEDNSGNGGGYVFDCRSTHNPGRYEPYKKITGLEEPVIRFLEDDGEILEFLKPVYQLADHHVERFMQRGFTNLMFCFGCTGGQHRSVYSAQHLAEHLNKKFGIEVHICHREQNIRQILPAR